MKSDRPAMAATVAPRSTKPLLYQFLRAALLLGTLAFSSQLLADSAGGDSRTYKLAPGDQITVTVFNQPELSADVVVIDGAGYIVLPFLEPLKVQKI